MEAEGEGELEAGKQQRGLVNGHEPVLSGNQNMALALFHSI